MIILEKITSLLDTHAVRYEIKEHAATPTSEEAAAARGEPLKIGAKALLLKVSDDFILAVLPANKKLNTRAIKKLLHSKNLRFATEEELEELTGLTKGAVPPFGGILGIDMIVDKTLFDEIYMAFNAGSLTTSIKIRTEDYQKITSPQREDISQ